MTDEEREILNDAAEALEEEFRHLVNGQPALAVAAAMGCVLANTIDDNDVLDACAKTVMINMAQRLPNPDMLTATYH